MDHMLCYRRLEGKDEHNAGRELLAEMYQKAVGEKMPPIVFGSRGKPFFEGSDKHFSISHTKTHVFCLLADEPVGLDAEDLSRIINPKLADRILSSSEKDQYQRCFDQNRALLSFWVMKEAFLKYTGTGLTGFPNDTSYSLNNKGLILCDGCIAAAYGKDGFLCFLTPMHI